MGDNDSQPISSTAIQCPHTELKVTVQTSSGDSVGNANVTLAQGGKTVRSGLTSDSDDTRGEHDFGRIDPGEYDVTVNKEWYLTPGGQEEASTTVTLAACERKVVSLTLDPVEIHMYLDSRRTRTADVGGSDMNVWQWGASGKGAVMLCNNDDDYDTTKKNASDDEDNEINEHNDDREVAPMAFRITGPQPPPTWWARLEVPPAHSRRVRIFRGRTRGSVEEIGPTQGERYDFPDLNFTERILGIEATQYADKDWDGELDLTFTICNSAGNERSETGKIRVAPWMMMHHLMQAENVYVVRRSGTNFANFRDALRRALPSGVTLNDSLVSSDIWAQDRMEIGFSSSPGATIHGITRSPQVRPLATIVHQLRDKDVGYEYPVAHTTRSSLNSFGNLEVTPPCEDPSGKRYPYGRIYYGDSGGTRDMNADFQTFLQRQVVQAPFKLDTDWLAVGHVDEMITFIPNRAGGFKCLVADPDLAMRILRDLPKCKKKKTKMFKGRRLLGSLGLADVETTVKDFLIRGLPMIGESAAGIRTANRIAKTQLDNAITTLRTKIRLQPDQVVRIPVLFVENWMFPGKQDALTANMVNMLIVNRVCIYPKPFGPERRGKDLFEEVLLRELRSLGLTGRHVDNWDTYHRAKGEIHCGTNTMRTATQTSWWEYEP